MRCNIVILGFIVASSCNSHPDAAERAKSFLIRFNPPVGATYHYSVVSETSLIIRGDDSDREMQKKSELVVNYRVSKDSSEFMLDTSFDKIHIYSKDGTKKRDIDGGNVAAGSDPLGRLVINLRTDTIFVRVNPLGPVIAFGGGEGFGDEVVDTFYSEADKEPARAYWQRWVDQEVIWENLAPLIWGLPDTAQHPGDYWRGRTTNQENINYEINHRFHLQSVDAGIATIQSEGVVRKDSARIWMFGKGVSGFLAADEKGACEVEIATGMPTRMSDWVDLEGIVYTSGGELRITMIQKIRMVREKAKN